jgi:hypothetical protein
MKEELKSVEETKETMNIGELDDDQELLNQYKGYEGDVCTQGTSCF